MDIKDYFSILVVIVHLGKNCLCHESSGLMFELPDKEQMCFFEDFQGSRLYIFEFKVLRGGNHDIDVLLESPNGKAIYKESKKDEDAITFEISWGTYKFCFSNEFSTITHKTIYFEVRPEVHRPLAVEGGRKAPSVNTQIEESMEVIHQKGTAVMKFQTAYRMREAKGRYGAEQLNFHVQGWSILQAVVILVTGFGQLFILKRFFTDKKTSLFSIQKPEVMMSVPPATRP